MIKLLGTETNFPLENFPLPLLALMLLLLLFVSCLTRKLGLKLNLIVPENTEMYILTTCTLFNTFYIYINIYVHIN